ncbi:putative transposable element [Trichonephila clavipes]|nr:putative transposable element [Trichonephila clavipes]
MLVAYKHHRERESILHTYLFRLEFLLWLVEPLGIPCGITRLLGKQFEGHCPKQTEKIGMHTLCLTGHRRKKPQSVKSGFLGAHWVSACCSPVLVQSIGDGDVHRGTRIRHLSPDVTEDPPRKADITDTFVTVVFSIAGYPRVIPEPQVTRRFAKHRYSQLRITPNLPDYSSKDNPRILPADFGGDEAHFWLNGYVNKQNCRIWREANPQVYVETPLHPEKLTVWCALWAGGIIGPYFFKNDEGHNVTVNGDRYRAMNTNFFIPRLNNHDVQELWFQQDGVTCHTARATIDLLKDTFGDRLISRFGLVNWSPRSCDLTPLAYFLWGYVKSLVYADKPQTLDHLEDNIRRVIADIRPQMLEKVIENWTSRLDYIRASVAVLCRKSYLKCNATRLSFE